MAFSFGNAGQSAFGLAGGNLANNAQVQTGPDLEAIQTEALGFLSLAGEAKVQLLPPWPSDNLPPPTASLMSVASRRGLIAAASPDGVIVASTESVRKAFEAPKTGDGQIRPFQPQLTIPMSMRVSQLAFTADENYLVLSAESGGGLAVYEVQSLLNGSTNSAFEMSTNSLSLRTLTPNPTPDKGELLAIVTTDGKLMMANLKERNFISGANGQILKDRVSSLSWSARGKQLVAGLVDGTASQMTPEGAGKAEIPRPPNVDDKAHVSSITWLENNVFLMVHTPSNFDPNQAPESVYHLVTRSQNNEHVFHKLTDPAGPFGLNRSSPHHFILRLRDFPPNLDDLLIVASTASTDIGLFSKSKVPLVSDKPASQVTGVFTMTEMSDDSRRAQLPMTEDMRDTSPIGMVLDLSSKEKVVKPIPSDEIDESPTPLPSLMVLNNEGILAAWWVVYSESIRQGSIYPGLVAAGNQQSAQPVQPSQTSMFSSSTPQTSNQPTFGSTSNPTSAFGSFAKPAAPAFGAPSMGTSSGNAFGGPSALGKPASVWGTPAGAANASPSVTFGTPSFGSSTTPATQNVAFGSSASLGSRTSVWGSAGTKAPGATFGQPGGLGMGGGSSFGSSSAAPAFGSGGTSSAPASGGFAAFADKGAQGGFAAIAANQNSGTSIFASKPATSAFGAGTGTSQGTSTSFGGSNNNTTSAPGGLFGGSGFTLGSTFKPDGTAKDDGPKPTNSTSSFFGNGFGNALANAQTSNETASPEADMDADEPEPSQQPTPQPINALAEKPQTVTSTTPASTPAAAKFQFPVASSTNSGLFGASVPKQTPLTAPLENKTVGFSFGKPAAATENKAETPSKTSLFFQPPVTPETPKIKEEPKSDDTAASSLLKIPEAPLPPDTTSKTSYAAGESSTSSIEPEPPLPPDFLPKSSSKTVETPSLPSKPTFDPGLLPPTDVPGGPEEDESDLQSEEEDGEIEDGEVEDEEDDEEGSGEDVTKDLSPTSESQHTPGFTPQSSFGGNARGPGDSLFTKISRPAGESSARPLFGEINGHAAPVLPPPKTLTSPRSPSPVRSAIPGRLLRPDSSRSVSAPGVASQLLGSRSTSKPVDTFALTLEQRKAEQRRQAELQARKEAEETRALLDEEDERLQAYLEAEIKSTKKLDDFIAHQDYVQEADKDSIPAQVEAVYRDINSMIDTLGVNSRSLKSFIKGHTELYKDEGRTRDDLEDDDEWCLIEIENLSSIIEKDLTKELEQGCVKDAPAKLEECSELEKELAKLRSRYEDLSILIASQRDPDRLASIKSLPLTAEQATQQHDLRRGFAKLQQLLADAEEGVILLKAKLASQNGTAGKSTASPTVEALMRTIKKMTNMAEKRSGDIDVLENQMRKLHFSPVANNRSREGSPFATPAKPGLARTPGTSSTYGLFYTPESIRSTPRGLNASLTSSTHSYGRGSPQRKKLNGFTEEDKSRLKAHAAKRKAVIGKLRAAIQKSAPRVLPLEGE